MGDGRAPFLFLLPLKTSSEPPYSVAGVPASNAQAVVNLMVTSTKLLSYSNAAIAFAAVTPSATSTFRA